MLSPRSLELLREKAGLSHQARFRKLRFSLRCKRADSARRIARHRRQADNHRMAKAECSGLSSICTFRSRGVITRRSFSLSRWNSHWRDHFWHPIFTGRRAFDGARDGAELLSRSAAPCPQHPVIAAPGVGHLATAVGIRIARGANPGRAPSQQAATARPGRSLASGFVSDILVAGRKW